MRRYIQPAMNNRLSVETNQQPKVQIVLKKDQKIQQLMMQNTQLKRQLSQLISKTSTIQTPLHSGMQSPQHQQLIKPNTAEFNSFLKNSLEQQSYDNHLNIRPNSNNINTNNNINNNNHQPRYYTNAVSTPTATSNSVSFQYPITNNNSNNKSSNRIASSSSTSPSPFNHTIHNTMYNKQTSTIYNKNNQARLSFNSDVNQSVCQQQQQQDNNRLTIRLSPVKVGFQKHGRSNTHSVDMCENYHPQGNNYSMSNNKNVTMVGAHNHQHHHRVQKSSITIGQGFGFPTSINQDRQVIYITQSFQPFNMQSPKAAQNITFRQDRSNEQQFYREKMMKLKAKKSPKLRQVSQEKTNKSSTPSLSIINRCQKSQITVNLKKNVNKSNKSMSRNTSRSIDKIEELKKAHEVLKAKLSPTKQVKDNAKMSTMQTEENQHIKLNNYSKALQINNNNNNNKLVKPKKQKSPISKLLSSQSLKTIESTKKLPKYIPKIFPKKQTHERSEKDEQKQSSTSSIDRVSKKTIEKDELMKQQPTGSNNKVQSRKQVRGRVYLEDESQLSVGVQKKQGDKIDNINSKSTKQISPLTTTISGPGSINNEPKSQAIRSSNKSQQPTDSTRKQSTDESVGEIGRVRMMRRNSNKVYMQEQDETNVRKSNYNKRTTIEQRVTKVGNSSNSISSRDRPPIRSRNPNPSQARQKISSIEQIHMGFQDNQQQQHENGIKHRKQLYNQVYCLQQSKIKLN